MSEARIPVKNFRSWDDVYALTTKAGVIFRPQGRKISPTVHYFPSVRTENNMHTYAIFRPYGRRIAWLHTRYFPSVAPSSEYRYTKLGCRRTDPKITPKPKPNLNRIPNPTLYPPISNPII